MFRRSKKLLAEPRSQRHQCNAESDPGKHRAPNQIGARRVPGVSDLVAHSVVKADGNDGGNDAKEGNHGQTAGHKTAQRTFNDADLVHISVAVAGRWPSVLLSGGLESLNWQPTSRPCMPAEREQSRPRNLSATGVRLWVWRRRPATASMAPFSWLQFRPHDSLKREQRFHARDLLFPLKFQFPPPRRDMLARIAMEP